MKVIIEGTPSEIAELLGTRVAASSTGWISRLDLGALVKPSTSYAEGAGRVYGQAHPDADGHVVE